MNQLEEARKEIDRIDTQLARLFEERMAATRNVAAYKKEHGLPIFDGDREKQVLEQCKERVDNPALKEDFSSWIAMLMELSKKYQRELLNENKVAYCGVEGAFAHSVTRSLFPYGTPVSCSSFDDVFSLVTKGEVRYGVVPIENSNSGVVGEVLDALREYPVFITQGADARIRQCLLGVKGAALTDIEWVYSKDQAIWQSRKFIDALGAKTVCYPNTAMAAQYIARENDPKKAAIGARENAVLYGLDVLAENIESSAANTTRFLVISAQPESQEEDFTGLLLTVPDTAGSLARAINVIAAFDLNMDSLQSRPVKSRPFEYFFFIQLAGRTSKENIDACLQALKPVCASVRSLGSYSIRKDNEL